MTEDSNASNANVDIPEDFNSFKSMFAGKESVAAPEEKEVADTEDDTLATDEDTDASEEEDEDLSAEDSEEEGEDEGSDEEPEEKPKSEDKGKAKKSSAQQRINELTRARHEAERREAALFARLEVLEKSQPKPEVSVQETIADNLPPGSPKPTDVRQDGQPKYPLGEFDPGFIVDLTRFNIRAELQAVEQTKAEQEAQRQAAAQRDAIRNNWSQKLSEAEEEIPEIREHIVELTEVFQNIQPQYGEYLATIIMTSENGPAIMEYLSQNIGEAQKIVASGPTAATLAIGRLEAKLQKPTPRPDGEEKRNKKPPTSKTPPPQNKGSRSGAGTVRPDTENLADFKREFGKLL